MNECGHTSNGHPVPHPTTHQSHTLMSTQSLRIGFPPPLSQALCDTPPCDQQVHSTTRHRSAQHVILSRCLRRQHVVMLLLLTLALVSLRHQPPPSSQWRRSPTSCCFTCSRSLTPTHCSPWCPGCVDGGGGCAAPRQGCTWTCHSLITTWACLFIAKMPPALE
jgi:hypothetical protein